MSSTLRPLAIAIAKAGILDQSVMQEFSKWGLPVEDLELGPPPQNVEDLVLSLEDALQSEGLVVERLTDFEVMRQYLTTQQIGLLRVVVGTESAEFFISFGKNPVGEYIIPWKGEAVAEEITNGQTCLLVDDKEVYFNQMNKLFFGDVKAFMVCTAS